MGLIGSISVEVAREQNAPLKETLYRAIYRQHHSEDFNEDLSFMDFLSWTFIAVKNLEDSNFRTTNRTLL